MSGITIPLLDKDTILKMQSEITGKLSEENIFPKEILEVISTLNPTEEFFDFVKEVFSVFCRKCNQDQLLATFYKRMANDWKSFFPQCHDQKAINLLLIHFPQKLVGHYKAKQVRMTTSSSSEVFTNIEIHNS